MVTPLPDMQPQEPYLKLNGVQMTKPYKAIIESQIELVAGITNTGGSTTGKFDVQFTDGTVTKWRQVANIVPGDSTILNVLFDLPKKPGTVQFVVKIDPNNTVEEISDNNNQAIATIDVFYGPDLTLSGFTHKSPVLETRSYVNLFATVNDLGVWGVQNVKVTFYKMLNGTTDKKLINSSQVANITAGGSAQATVNWTLNDGDEGNYTMTTCVNEDGSAVPTERTENKTNNCMTNYMIIAKMQVQISVGYPQFLTEPGIEVEGGKQFVLSGSVVRASNGAPVVGVRVTITIEGSTLSYTTNSNGGFLFMPTAPSSSGTHKATLTVEGFDYVLPGFVYVKPTAELIPLWMLILIIIIVAVVAVVGAMFALGKSARGKMVECGECGTLISESRTTCPKCHAVFEANVVKCSSCLAWIPATANECPKCGVVFVGKKKKGETYEEIMRKQYDEWVETFRKRYRGKVGARFTEPAFMQWFKQQDDHLTFQQWMAAEESKKRGKACPQCGTANPLDAQTCQRCGSEFAAGEEAPAGTKPGPPPTGVAPKAVERADTEKLAPKTKAVPAAGEKRRVVKGAPEAGGEIKKRCPTCSAMNPIEKEICIDCGEKLPPAITCTGCSNLIPGDAKFCPVCGKPQ
jgi:RNA polymerase subunit RPABC4/transcription elongation factor Spt4